MKAYASTKKDQNQVSWGVTVPYVRRATPVKNAPLKDLVKVKIGIEVM